MAMRGSCGNGRCRDTDRKVLNVYLVGSPAKVRSIDAIREINLNQEREWQIRNIGTRSKLEPLAHVSRV